MFDNRWENWAGDFADSFAASHFDTATRERIPEILSQFGTATRRIDPGFPDQVASRTFESVLSKAFTSPALTPSVRAEIPEVVARFFEFLQDGGRLGAGYAWAEQVRSIRVPAAASSRPSPTKGTPVRNTPQTAVGRNDPCPCGSGKKYKKCCYQ